MTGSEKDSLWKCCQSLCVFQDRLYQPFLISKTLICLQERESTIGSKKVIIEDENPGSLPVGWRPWRCNLVVTAWRKCKMKSVEIYGSGTHASERSSLCHLKKDFNKWLALSPVRHSSCGWLGGDTGKLENRKSDRASSKHPFSERKPELTVNTLRDKASIGRAELYCIAGAAGEYCWQHWSEIPHYRRRETPSATSPWRGMGLGKGGLRRKAW